MSVEFLEEYTQLYPDVMLTPVEWECVFPPTTSARRDLLFNSVYKTLLRCRETAVESVCDFAEIYPNLNPDLLISKVKIIGEKESRTIKFSIAPYFWVKLVRPVLQTFTPVSSCVASEQDGKLYIT